MSTIADLRVRHAAVATAAGWVERLRPVHVGILASLVALAFVGARLLVPADGDISRLVVAGDEYTDPATVDPEIHVLDDAGGYDGQFFWRLAVDPLEWDTSRPHHGVQFDNAYRPPRIVYPVLAWLAAGGQPELVASALVAVNVAACGVVAYLGALLARARRRPAVTGLVLAAIPGLVFAVARDLAEVVTMAAVLAGVLALQRGRPALAAVAWSVAVASREQAMLVVAGYGIWRVVTLARGWAARRAPAGGDGDGAAPAAPDEPGGAVRPGAADLPWLVPPLLFVAWQGLLWARLGELPLASSSTNLTWPFRVLVPTAVGWLQGDIDRWDVMAPLQIALAITLVTLAVTRGRAHLAPEDRWLLVSLGLVVALGVSFGRPVWEGPADLRQVIDVFTLSWLALLLCPPSQRIPPWLAGAAGAIWVGTAAIRAYAI